MQSSSGNGNDQNPHYTLNFPPTQGAESFYGSVGPASTSASNIPGLLRLVPTSPMGMPAATSSGIQTITGSSSYGGSSGAGVKRTSQDAGFPDQRHCEIASSDDDHSLSDKFSMPQTSISPSDSQQMKNMQVATQPSAKKTKGRVKIKMEFIDNKLRRYTTFSKRKTGIMKKAYELSTLTGTQVMLLVASETGHVYTFATRKLQPMITSEAGKALIQTCLNSPDPPSSAVSGDQRMSATGFEETELCYNINEDEQKEYDGDEVGVEEEDEESSSERGTASGRDVTNGYQQRPAHSSQPHYSPVYTSSTEGNVVSTGRTSGSSSVLVNTSTVAPPAASPVTTHQLLTSQLLSQIKHSQQLALHLAASGHVPASGATSAATTGTDHPRIIANPMSSLLQTSTGLLQLPEGMVLLNNPATVIQAVKTEHAGSPPHASQPTDLSKSRVINRAS